MTNHAEQLGTLDEEQVERLHTERSRPLAPLARRISSTLYEALERKLAYEKHTLMQIAAEEQLQQEKRRMESAQLNTQYFVKRAFNTAALEMV